jgi:hypothetical protein
MPLAISENVWYFAAAAAVSLTAFVWLILIPALSAYGRWYEKVGAGFISLFIFGTLTTIGVVGGLAYVFFANDVSGIFPWSTG